MSLVVQPSLLLKVVRRQEHNIANLTLLLQDPRARLLASRLTTLNRQIDKINNLIDPSVEGKIPRSPDERQVATLNKTYLAQVHAKLASATSNLVTSITRIMDTMFDVDDMVQTRTDLSTNLGKIYRAVLDKLEKLNTILSTIEGSTYPDEILKSVAELRKTWVGLQLLLTHQITEPLLSSIAELARENALKLLSVTIYGSRTNG